MKDILAQILETAKELQKTAPENQKANYLELIETVSRVDLNWPAKTEAQMMQNLQDLRQLLVLLHFTGMILELIRQDESDRRN
jgi:DNA phosphorothioation-dependent restriction protein DptG